MQYIRLAYRMVIDYQSNSLWEKYVFEDTYAEYKMQHQTFDNKENPSQTFKELRRKNVNADQMHFLVSTAATHYIEQLNNNIYQIKDHLGSSYLTFEFFKFEIINSDIQNIENHKIGITLYSPVLRYLDKFNDLILISQNIIDDENIETLMFQLRPNLSISHWNIKIPEN